MAAKQVAILGAGMIGEVHRRAAVLAGAQVLGVMASSPERSREVARAWGVEQAYGSIEEVAESKAEIVHICTPNASHVPYAVALMQAGKHVLCEKPLGSASRTPSTRRRLPRTRCGQYHPVRVPVPPDGAGNAGSSAV